MLDYKLLSNTIVSVENFPKEGVSFKDITPIFQNPDLVNQIIDEFAQLVQKYDFDYIIAPESRGYLFGIPLALKLNKPFVFVRKQGKIPRPVFQKSYGLEYGQATLELAIGDIKPNSKVLIVDDILATGGTIGAINQLVDQSQAQVVGGIFLIALESLKIDYSFPFPIDALLKA